MTRIQISLALMTILLFQVEMAAAAKVTLAFEGHFVGVRTDGGDAALPAGIDMNTSFSGTVTYQLGTAVNLPYLGLDASAGSLFYSFDAHELTLNVGGYHIQSQSNVALFLDDVLNVDTGSRIDAITLPFAGDYPFGEWQSELVLQFGDVTASAMDNIVLTEPLDADWFIPTELFGDIGFQIAVYEELAENYASVWPPYKNYYMLEGQIDSIREVPLPAAGAMFALALMQLVILRRRLT